MLKKIISIAMIPAQVYLGYLIYNTYMQKQSAQPKVITKKIVQNQTVTRVNMPKDPRNADLSNDLVIQNLQIGKANLKEVTNILGKPDSIHQNSIYVYKEFDLLIENDVVLGYAIPGFFASKTASLRTPSGLTVGSAIEELTNQYGGNIQEKTGSLNITDKQRKYSMVVNYDEGFISSIMVTPD